MAAATRAAALLLGGARALARRPRHVRWRAVASGGGDAREAPSRGGRTRTAKVGTGDDDASPPSSSSSRRPRRRVATTSRPRGGGGDPPGEASAHQIASLVVWLRARGVDFGDRAAFARVRGMGVGGVATRDLDEGDVVFSLPMRDATPARAPIVMTTAAVTDVDGPCARLARALAAAGLVPRADDDADASSESPLGGSRESDHEFPLDATRTSLLALGVLHESAHSRDDPPSHWATYVTLLPRRVGSLMEWDERELSALQGSRHATRARERIALFDDARAKCFPALLRADESLFGEDEATRRAHESPRAWRWAVATVLARAFYFPDANEHGLCPGLDLFNHCSEAEKCVVEDGTADDEGDEGDEGEGKYAHKEAPRVTLRAGVGGVPAGTQIFHDYADHARGGCLLEFGFTHAPSADAAGRDGRADLHAVDVSLWSALIEGDDDDGRIDERLAAASDASPRRSLTYELSNVSPRWAKDGGRKRGVDCVPIDMMRAARALTLSASELDEVKSARASRVGAPAFDASAPLNETHEKRALLAIARACRVERAGYDVEGVAATTAEEDDAILDALRALGEGEGAAALAIDGRPELSWCVPDDDADAARERAETRRLRASLAVEVRRGEKLLLEEVAAALEREAGAEDP
jgi:hypothetical protein